MADKTVGPWMPHLVDERVHDNDVVFAASGTLGLQKVGVLVANYSSRFRQIVEIGTHCSQFWKFERKNLDNLMVSTDC